MTATQLPQYDWTEPARLQEHDWDCSVESIEWCLYAWGRAPDDDWLEQTMIAEGVVSPELGCLDASGAGLAAFVNRHYGEYGYLAENDSDVSFDDVRAEAGATKHPIAVGGRGWYHWSGCRNYDLGTDQIILANPAPGWKGIHQAIGRADWDRLGPWSMVRVTHPAAEGNVDPPPEYDYSFWQEGGKVGSGLIDMMRVDGVYPAQDYSTWLPLGRMPAQIESCYGTNGTEYIWLLTESRGFRHAPTG